MSDILTYTYVDTDRFCHPVLTPPAAKVLQKHYLNMRSSSAGGYAPSSSALAGDGTIPVTTRHLESLIRLSQARARMELREEVRRIVIDSYYCYYFYFW